MFLSHKHPHILTFKIHSKFSLENKHFCCQHGEEEKARGSIVMAVFVVVNSGKCMAVTLNVTTRFSLYVNNVQKCHYSESEHKSYEIKKIFLIGEYQ